MPTFEVGDIVRVPFPYTDRATRQHRPALIVGTIEGHGLLWVVMITSAENRRWPLDVPAPDGPETGLPVPSWIRPAKIATIDARDAQRIGRSPDSAFNAVQHAVREILSL